VAPDNFKTDDDDNHANVFKQPENADKADACHEAFEGCLQEAIGDDSEQDCTSAEGCFSAACGRVFFL